jgi:sugar (pentulose or hexulose) kinase
MESAAWWEASQIEAIGVAAERPVSDVHLIGGTARNLMWLQRRADAYQRAITVYSAGGALGAILPGLLLNGILSSSEAFLDRYRIAIKRVEPRPLSSQAEQRRENAFCWIEAH